MLLTDLPDHILVSIFKLLPDASKMQFSATCPKLRELLFYPSLWADYQLVTDKSWGSGRDGSVSVHSLDMFFQQVPVNSLSAITWNLNDVYKEVLQGICIRNKTLRYLQISNSKLKNEDLKFFCAYLKHLDHLGIASTKISGDCLEYIQELTSLSSIDLSKNAGISERDFYSFIEHFQDNQIVNINLENVNLLMDRSILVLLSKHSSTLQELNIDGEKNTDDVFGAISKCCKLHSLTVNDAGRLTDAALKKIPFAQRFRKICIKKGSNFTDQGLKKFLSRSFSDLTVLNLTACSRLSNSGAAMIGTNCPNLTHLYLRWCTEVEDEGILPILTGCNKMVEMDLTGLHSLSANPLRLIPMTMTSLRLLTLMQSFHRVEMMIENRLERRETEKILKSIVQRMRGQLVVIGCYHQRIVFNAESNDVEYDEQLEAYWAANWADPDNVPPPLRDGINLAPRPHVMNLRFRQREAMLDDPRRPRDINLQNVPHDDQRPPQNVGM